MPLSRKEQAILDSIKVASYNDPNRPEFPADNPKFPATPTYKIDVPGFTNVYLKDESKNPTGTHKDRMAWEMVVTYRDILLAKKRGQYKGALPHMSIISSGSAALAIQTQLKKYGLPSLKVLIDYRMDPQVVTKLRELGCSLYKTDLSVKPFTWEEILRLTHNSKGLEITSSEALDPTLRFYDWLSYEILNSSPEWCFIPFGTGNLFENILNINKVEISHSSDPRFKGDVKKLRACNFVGASVNSPDSKADKLYSAHLPFVHFNEQWLRTYKYSGYCGVDSHVNILKDQFLDKAIAYAVEHNIDAEPSGIAGLGMLFQMRKSIPKDAKILIVNTGKSKF